MSRVDLTALAPDPTDLTPRGPDDSAVEMTQLVLPNNANNRGTAFGGQIMAWIDIAAAVCAARHARGGVVTASVDAVDFVRPVLQGHVVVLKARVNYVGRTSLEIGVRVEGEVFGGGRYHATTAYTTFVALDDDGTPRPVAPLLLCTDEDRRRHAEAEERMAARRKRAHGRAARLDSLPPGAADDQSGGGSLPGAS
jgi:acyl-CoA hydrolase